MIAMQHAFVEEVAGHWILQHLPHEDSFRIHIVTGSWRMVADGRDGKTARRPDG
jgi:hypothetical protein